MEHPVRRIILDADLEGFVLGRFEIRVEAQLGDGAGRTEAFAVVADELRPRTGVTLVPARGLMKWSVGETMSRRKLSSMSYE